MTSCTGSSYVGDNYRFAEKFCLIGAITYTCKDLEEEKGRLARRELRNRYQAAISALFCDRVDPEKLLGNDISIAMFNDSADTTFDDIQKVINYVENLPQTQTQTNENL